MSRFLRCFAGLLLMSGCLFAQTVTRDVLYTTDGAGAQRGDVYLPAGAGPFPVIVYVHGGSWRSGDKSEFKQLGTDLAASGYAGFSINYDLHAGTYPLAWQQTRAAVAFVRTHAAEYHVDPARVVIAGSSAGGELAALVALVPGGPAVGGGADEPVAGAVILNGVFDLCYPAHVIQRYMGGSCKEKKAAFEDASPLRRVHPGAPPFYVGHGTKDHVVPYAAEQQFLATLAEQHVPATVYVAQGGPHMYWEKKAYYADNLAKLKGFLAGVVGGTP